MLSIFSKFALACTSTAPALLIYSIVVFIDKRTILEPVIFFISFAFLILFFYTIIRYVTNKGEHMSFNITKVEIIDKENMSILLLYLSPILRISTEADYSWLIVAIIIVMFTIIIAISHGYQFNPILNIFRWHSYRVDTPKNISYILITKKQIKNFDRENFDVCLLDEYTVIDFKGEIK